MTISRQEYLKEELTKLREILPDAEYFLQKYERAVSNNKENTEDFAANFKISLMSFYLSSTIKYINYKMELEEILKSY